MTKKIALLPGDGIGPEITKEAIKILGRVSEKYHHKFDFQYGLIGAVAIDETGDPFPKITEDLCLSADAILFGAIGEPKYDNDPKAKIRPEQGLLRMRKTLGLYANIRPIQTHPALYDKSPLKKDRIEGVDFIVVRELIGGIYFGERGRTDGGKSAFDTATYTEHEVERVARYAFQLAMIRRRKLLVVDKANVLETSRLWRETVQKISVEFPAVNVDFMFVDNCAMQIIKNPRQFDVILTENMFGDILSDEASVITGSIGMMPSASIGEKTSLYEPIHGSYPKATGKNSANPIGTILSAAWLLELSFDMQEEAKAIRMAVSEVLSEGFGTKDLFDKDSLGTVEIGDKIVEKI